MRPHLDLSGIEDLSDLTSLMGYLEPEEARELDYYLRARSRREGPDLLEYARLAYRGQFDIARHHMAIARALRGVEDGSIKRLMIFAPPRHGKLLADDTPILTPSGWLTHGELLPGDHVYHPSGAPTRVVAISEPAPARVAMEWTTGETIWCHEAHEWQVFDGAAAGRGRERRVSAGWLAGRPRRRKRGILFGIPAAAPIAGNRTRRPDDWIGLRSAVIDPTSERIGRCIEVEASDGMYLAGRTLVPTHNSTLATMLFPAWYLGRNPDKQVMIVSYSDDLAADFSREVRNQISAATWPWPDVRLASDRWAADDWKIANRLGGCRAVGVQGAIIGKGTDLLVFDDPIKNREEADNPTARARLLARYQNDIYSRLEPGAAVIIMLQRWHKADLSGALLDNAQEDPRADQWVVLDMPAIALEGDMLGRKAGEALWPERKSLEELRATEVNVGPRAWNANWQQRPTTQEGLYFKREHFTWRWRHEEELRIDRVIQVVDSAFKEGVSTSRSAICTWVEGFFDGRPFCGPIHAWAERVEYPSLIQKLKELNAFMTTRLGRAIPLYIEDKASGTSAIQTLRAETRIAVVAYQPPSGSSKESRAESATHFFSARRVALPQYASWIEEWVEEHADYPTAKTNDLVDTTGMALDIFYGLGNAPTENPIPEGVRPEDWVDSAGLRDFDDPTNFDLPDEGGLFVI